MGTQFHPFSFSPMGWPLQSSKFIQNIKQGIPGNALVHDPLSLTYLTAFSLTDSFHAFCSFKSTLHTPNQNCLTFFLFFLFEFMQIDVADDEQFTERIGGFLGWFFSDHTNPSSEFYIWKCHNESVWVVRNTPGEPSNALSTRSIGIHTILRLTHYPPG